MSHTSIPVAPGRYRESFGRYFEDFVVGDVYEHRPGRTISETDNTWFTLLTMNTHPMKLVTIICEAHARDAVTKLLREVGAHGWTLFAVEGDGARGQRPADIPVLVGSNAKLRADTGWAPSLSRADIITDLLNAPSH